LKITAFAGNDQKVHNNAVFTLHTGETVVQVAAVEVSVNHPSDLGPPKSILPGVMLVIDLREGFEIVLDKFLRSWAAATQTISIEDINSTVEETSSLISTEV
jgi:hypothetical protein